MSARKLRDYMEKKVSKTYQSFIDQKQVDDFITILLVDPMTVTGRISKLSLAVLKSFKSDSNSQSDAAMNMIEAYKTLADFMKQSLMSDDLDKFITIRLNMRSMNIIFSPFTDTERRSEIDELRRGLYRTAFQELREKVATCYSLLQNSIIHIDNLNINENLSGLSNIVWTLNEIIDGPVLSI